jgi:phosphate transport system substrate-binding protein
MASQASSVYCPFIRGKLHLSGSVCPSVSFYPAFGNSKAQNGSNGVANYVSASYGAGAIGYVEYAYAKRINFPVVSLLNRAGYFSQPTAGNVAVALTRAKINKDLTQNLESVYTNPDPRAYPMSSYSYMIVPTSTAAPFNTDKGRTLSTFINYFLCTGQQKADILGYSPLPKNLVLAGFQQVARIPGAVKSPSITQCHNPALDILQSAPMPNKCMKLGSDCTVSTTSPTGGNTTSGPGGTPGSSTSAGPGGTTPGAGGSDPLGTSGSGPGSPGSGAVDPLTGGGAGTTSTGAGGTVTTAGGTPVSLAASRTGQQHALGWLVALMLALAVLAPPFLVARASRRDR